MYISELRIRHFRNFMCSRMNFRKGVNTLIGENGSGKTNAFYALRLLLDDYLSRNAIYLRETDFCRALGDWRGHWIIIAIEFEELDPSEGCQMLKHQTGHMDASEKGTYTLYFRPKLEVRNRLHELTNEGAARKAFEEYLATITIEQYEPLLTGRSQADFLNNDTYRDIVGDFEGYSFPDPNDEDQAPIGVRMSSIQNEFSCTFAPALRDVVNDLRGYRTNPLLALLRGTESSIQIEDAERITGMVSQLNSDISALPEVKEIATGIQSTLQSTVGHTYSPAVSIESTLPDRLEKLLQRLSVTIAETPDATYREELSEQSLGGANLIYLALKMLEYELKLSSDRVAHFLLIEEPEAHIHTHIQKTLFENQSNRRTQVIVSTHSTHISSAAKIGAVNVLARQSNKAEVYQPARGLGEQVESRVERYLDAVRSTLLFAKGVILVEGEAELVMVPAMMKAVFGMSPDELGISVISMNSAFFKHIAILFHDNRIRRHCAVVTDSDRAFIDLPEDPEDDDEEQRHARAAQTSGEQRKATLDALTENNQWIEAFYADHTFEVDFVAAGNAQEVKAKVDTIYSHADRRKEVKLALDSNDIEVYGKQVLQLAAKVGKGWFALLLSEALQANTYVPSYILRAIAFAAPDITEDAIKRMGLYRVRSEIWEDEIMEALGPLEALETMEASDFVEKYREDTPEDDLTELLGYVDEYGEP